MKRHLGIAALALVPLVGLSACSNGELVATDAPAAQSAQDPNLDSERIEEVLQSTQAALDEADAALDSSILNGRVTQGAARVRAAQYAYATASGDTLSALDLTAEHIAVTNSQSWPRAILNIRQSNGSGLPVVQVFVQDDARSSYSLTNWCRMLGGTSVTIPSIDEGSAYVSDDSTGFVMTPKEALQEYVDMLNAELASNERFATDEFTTNYLETVSTLSTSLEAAGSVTAEAAVSEYPISGVVVQDGSALVAANFTYTLTYSRTIAGSTMRLGGQTATLNEGTEDTVTGTAVATYVATVLISIPSTTQGGVARIVGADRNIESITLDDSTNPDNS